MFLTHALRAISRGIAVVTDPFFKYVSLLLTGSGTNGAQNNTFVDSSTNNFAVTRVGNTTQGTFSPYGSNWSNYFDGTGDYLTTPATGQFAPTGDFTISFWYYPTVLVNYGTPIGNYTASTPNDWLIESWADGTLKFYASGGSASVASAAGALKLGQWHYISMSRSGTTITGYINGVSQGTSTRSGTFGSASKLISIGALPNGTSPITGYISDVKLLAGFAITSVPTAPQTVTTGTSLLTCQSNRFIDNSTNNFTITKNGDVSVQRFSPYSPAASYSTSEVGGSGYFDATGDWLTVPSSNVFLFGTGDFTIEFWVYPNAFSGRIFYGGTSSAVNITMSSSGAIVYGTITSGTIRATSAGAAPLNVWTHVAIARASGITRIFVNGVNASQGSDATNWASGSTVRIGSDTVGSFTGLISSLRVVKGTAVYTANFAPPTAPLTAITNTSLLLNFTNGGIIDNAMMNDLETVGNAQISTAQSKFGGSSMYFDGTGDYLHIPQNELLNPGTGQFTIEMWLNPTTTVATAGFYAAQSSGSDSRLATQYYNATGLGISRASGWIAYTSTVPATGSWTHIAFTRDSSNAIRIFFNGVAQTLNGGAGTTITDASGFLTTPMRVGEWSGAVFNGYIADLRITKGSARYTANFTPPTAPLPTS